MGITPVPATRRKRLAGVLKSGKMIVRPLMNRKARKAYPPHMRYSKGRMVLVIHGVKNVNSKKPAMVYTSPVLYMIGDEIHCANNSYWILKGPLE